MSEVESDWKPGPRPWGLGDALALAAWTVALVVFFRDALVFGKALFYFDITEINYPYRDFLARSLKAGQFWRWHPGMYNGMPLFAESQAGYLHPLKFVFYPWMETWRAFNLDTIGSIWLAGLATYGWLRRHVGPSGALAGAALFGLSGFVWAHLIHTSMTNALISVPLAFWALECSWDGGRLRGAAIGALALACQVFAGHLQDTILTAGAIGIVTLYRASTARGLRAKLTTVGFAALLGGLGVAVAAIQWVPSKDLLDRSPRDGGLTWEQITYGSWGPELLPTLVFREAYGTLPRDTDWLDGYYPYHEMNAYMGLVGLALAIVGAGAWRDRWVATWILLAGLGGLFMLGKFTALFDYMNYVPVVGASRDPGPVSPLGLDRRGGPGGGRRRPLGDAGCRPAPDGPGRLDDLGGGLGGTPRLHLRADLDGHRAEVEHARAPRAFPLARPRDGHRRRADRGDRPGGLGVRVEGGEVDPAIPSGVAGVGLADPDPGGPAGITLGGRPDHRPGLLHRPARVGPADRGRPGDDPGLRDRRAIGRRAGVRLASRRLLRGPRDPGLGTAADLGPPLVDGAHPDLPPARLDLSR